MITELIKLFRFTLKELFEVLENKSTLQLYTNNLQV